MANQIWYFTFGVDTPLGDRIQPVEGTYDDARELIFAAYGRKWSMQYSEAEGKEQIKKYNYIEMPLMFADEDDDND